MVRFGNNTDSNQLSGAHFYWTVLTARHHSAFIIVLSPGLL